MATFRASRYRARDPRTTPLYRLVEALYDEVRGLWEERFERRYGFWRGIVDEQVRRYLDCGLFENGFARIRCPDCREEYLLAFSCKTRDLCPSCAAKRGAATAALLAEDVLEEVGHSQWVFVMPKMLRPYFLHHRELLGKLALAAWGTVREVMVAAVGDDGLRPGMVAVVQTAGDLGNWHPHVHALVSRGGWARDWEWVPVPYVDEHAAELLFRHKVIRLLQGEGLLSEERTELLLSWRHTGFSVHNGVRVEPEDEGSLERLARYILRPPISLERMRWDGAGKVRYRRKAGHDGGVRGSQGSLELFDPADFLARVIMHSRAAAAPGALLRLVLECVQGEEEWAGGEPDRGFARCRSAFDLRRAGPFTRRPGAAQAVGGVDQAGVRGGPADLPSLRRRDAGHRLHHRPGGGRQDLAASRAERG